MSLFAFQFQALRSMVQSNPQILQVLTTSLFLLSFPPFHINLLHFGGFQCVLELKLLLLLQPMLQELGKQNPQLLRLIQEHQAEFLQLINEPVDGSEG